MIEKIQILAYRRFVFLIFRFFFLFILGIFIIRFFIFSPGAVNGPSMEPNFIDENLFFVNRIQYLFQKPERFDVVQFIEAKGDSLILKRIIGLPGETVVIRHGKVFIKKVGSAIEEELDESSYLSSKVYTDLALRNTENTFIVPENSYFVLGDNRPRSIDSRYWGSIHRSQIIGHIYSLPKIK